MRVLGFYYDGKTKEKSRVEDFAQKNVRSIDIMELLIPG